MDNDEKMKLLIADISTDNANMAEVLTKIVEYGCIDGAHHKDWLLDQIVHIIAGDKYNEFVELYEDADEDGYPQYEWLVDRCAP